MFLTIFNSIRYAAYLTEPAIVARLLIHAKKHTLDFDPWTIFDELIPYVNQQIDEVEMELKIRGLPFIPSDYRKEISKFQENHKDLTKN